MKNFIQSLSKQRKQVLLLYSTTFIGICIGILSSVINTRFLSPINYGDVRYVQNIYSFIGSLLLFGYFLSGSRLLAISDDLNYCRRIKGCMIIILALASFILMICSCILGFYYKDKSNLDILFWISTPICMGPLLLNYINTTAQGDNQIGRLSLARLLPSLLYVLISFFIYSLFGATSVRMMILQLGLSCIVLWIIIISTRPSFKNLKPVFLELNKENKEYGIQLYIGSLVMVATNYLAGISIGIFNTDNTEVGFYSLALTITAPLATLPSIIGTTYFKQFSRQKKIPTRVLKITFLLTLSSCILFILLIKPFVNILYSDKYIIAANYAMALAIGFSLHGFGDMINRYLGSHGQGKSIRNASIANGIFKIFGYTVLVYYLNTVGAILTTIICDVIYCITLLYYYCKFIKT